MVVEVGRGKGRDEEGKVGSWEREKNILGGERGGGGGSPMCFFLCKILVTHLTHQ